MFCDTGVRTSADVCRVVALGAHGALIGRPPLFALMCGGKDAVKSFEKDCNSFARPSPGSPALTKMLCQWRDDIRDDMRCLGWEKLSEVPKGVIYTR